MAWMSHFLLQKINIYYSFKGGIKYIMKDMYLETEKVRQELNAMITKITGLSSDEIDDEEEFIQLGMDSFMMILFRKRIQKKYGIELTINDLFENFKTIEFMAANIINSNTTVLDEEEIIVEKEIEHPVSANQPKQLAEHVCDLTSAERRLYLLSQIKEGNQAYQIFYCFELSDFYSNEQIKNAFTDICIHNNIMRCAYKLMDGSVKRCVFDTIDILFHEINLESTADVKRFEKEWRAPFLLEHAPLWKVAVVKEVDGKRRLYLNIHHIICDGKSIDLILQELKCRLDDERQKLPRTKTDYSQLFQAENGNLLSDRAEKQKQWWMNKFKQLPEPLNLPIEEPRKEMFDFRGETLHFKLDEKISENINKVLQHSQVTPFMFFLSTWVLLIHKLSEQHDFCIGVPWDLRSMGEFKHTMGMFIQTLPLRFQVNENDAYSALLQQVKEECLTSYEFADYTLII